MNELLDIVKRVGLRLDAMALDLARDAGRVGKSAKALADASREQASIVAKSAQAFADATRDQATMVARATPRVMQLAQAAAAVVARWRWLRLAQAARTGEPDLREEDHRDLARRAAAGAAELRGGIAKLGQLASCRPDLIGAVWANQLRTLQGE